MYSPLCLKRQAQTSAVHILPPVTTPIGNAGVEFPDKQLLVAAEPDLVDLLFGTQNLEGISSGSSSSMAVIN